MKDTDVILPEQEHRGTLSFRRSFWVLLGAIAILQIGEVALTIHYWSFEKLPDAFYRSQGLFATGWYASLLCAISFDLRLHGLSLPAAINIDPEAIRARIPSILKYFLGTAFVVIGLSLLRNETELGLENQDSQTIALSFGVTVLVAPLVEEIAFRGYLYPGMFATFSRKKERMVVNAMLFASAHVFLVAFVLGASVPYYVFVLGYLLASLYEESRSVVPGIILHSLNNGLVFTIDLFKLSTMPG